jgi:hypothetical protein
MFLGSNGIRKTHSFKYRCLQGELLAISTGSLESDGLGYTSALPLISSVAVDKLFLTSVSQFLHLYNGVMVGFGEE